MAENVRIALAGNPNCGKTTLFNALTGLNQTVGNWPGVTVEKKEGKLKKYDGAIVVDLPGIYSLSPYTLEEVVARNYLTVERPDVILNIVDGTNIERNLYLTTQLIELGIPVVVAINMVDVLRKQGDKINIERLSERLRCPVFEISALKGLGIEEAATIDGCTPLQTFFLVVLPVLKPTAVTVAILNSMWIWNDYLLPYLVIGSDYKTIPVAVQYLRGGYGAADTGAMMAVLVLAVIPVVIFYLFAQRYIINGVAAGAVKG